MRPDSDEPADRDLRSLLSELDPKARDTLRRVLIHDQADRDAIASRLMRYRDQNGQDWADIIDMLTMYPEARQKVVWLLGEIEAAIADFASSSGELGLLPCRPPAP